MKNILFLIYDLERGGPELRLLDFARHFPESKMFICSTSTNLALLPEFQKLGTAVSVVPVRRAYLEPGKILRIFREVKANRISVINVFDIKGLMIGAVIKTLLFGKIKLVFHTVNSIDHMGRGNRNLFRLLLSVSDGSICNSEYSRGSVKKYISGDKLTVIYNGIDTKYFAGVSGNSEFRARLGIAPGEIVIGTVANFRKQKNYPFLLRAFKKMLEKRGNMKLLCAGGGAMLEEMKHLADELGIAPNVIFPGYVSDTAGYMAVMDVFVLCSLWEGLPNAIIQAMCMGVPVISSNVCGCPEIITHMHDGLLFEAGNEDEFTDMVAKILDNSNMTERLIKNARLTVNRKFSLQSMVDGYISYFTDLAQ